jgi:6-phosphofructokinase 1
MSALIANDRSPTVAALKGNAIVAQSGGPSAVINQSLVGVIEGLRPALKAGTIGAIYGARHGVRGMVDDNIIDLTATPQETLDRVAATPSSALGSTRDKPDAAYCEKILATLRKREVRYFFYIGGNDSSDTCRIVNELAAKSGYEMRAFHIPKTIDNDLMMNDHTPGYASAARYVAMAFLGDNLDNRALPGIKINVVMGRHAGFLTGASALLRQREDDGPHLVYIPEIPFNLDRVAGEVEAVYRKHKRCLIAVSEGVSLADGAPLLATLTSAGKEKDAHGNVRLSGTGALGDALAEELSRRLTPAGGKPPRTRADTLGYAQRYWPDASPVDQAEARGSARFGAQVALAGNHHDGSIAIVRTGGPGSPNPRADYKVEFTRVELTDVAAKTRHMPKEFIAGTSGVSPAFLDWLRPMIGATPRVGWL